MGVGCFASAHATGIKFAPSAGRWGFRQVADNREGDRSLGKFQFLVWTAVILPVSIWIYFIRLLSGVMEPFGSIPTNILALMGINAVTVPVSEAVSHRKCGDTPPNAAEAKAFWGMLTESRSTPTGDVHQFSLARFHMFMWTFVSVAIYLFVV